MTLSEAREKLKPYEGSWLYDEMESFLLSFVHENPDMTLEMLKVERDVAVEELKDLKFQYGGE